VESMGRIEQVGKLEAIHARPVTEFVKDFITA
jgi:ABC-type Fe3+/spermidine/putrescine transport system ATPase subunit